MPAPKYIMNPQGCPVVNPQYQKEHNLPTTQPPPPSYLDSLLGATSPPVALAIASTIDDMVEIGGVTKLPMPETLDSTLKKIQSDDYVANFSNEGQVEEGNNASVVEGGDLVDGLSVIFSRLEIPMGLLSKLTTLQDKVLIITIDDSGSMSNASNLQYRDTSPYFQSIYQARNPDQYMTRWQEAEDRLYVITELLAYVPINSILLRTFHHPGGRRGRDYNMKRQAQSPTQFLSTLRTQIQIIFGGTPQGGTPMVMNIRESLYLAATNYRGQMVFHYILTDGEPDGRETEIWQIKDLVMSRPNPHLNPMTFLGCSNNRVDFCWIHELEELGQYIAALPDYRDEVMDVRTAQGVMFPYTRGLWIICNIVAAINPQDLDGLDEDMPLSKLTIENIMGRGLTIQEYEMYFVNHPDGRVFDPEYSLFVSSETAMTIPGVIFYMDFKRRALNADINNGDDNSDAREKINAQNALRQWYRSNLNNSRAAPQQQAPMQQQQQQQQQQTPIIYGANIQSPYRRYNCLCC
jgi:hypothetical protein